MIQYSKSLTIVSLGCSTKLDGETSMNPTAKNQQISPEPLTNHWLGHRIGGKWVKDLKGGTVKTVVNPSRGDSILTIESKKDLALEAVESAVQSMAFLKQVNFSKRINWLMKLGKVLEDHQSDLVTAMQLEVGKPRWDAELEVASSVSYLKWLTSSHEGIYQKLTSQAYSTPYQGKVTLQPVGVVSAYLPYSTPVATFTSFLSGALLAGCPISFFLPTQNTLVGSLLAKFDDLMEFPKGFYNLIFGGFENFKASLTDSRVAAGFYVGSKDHCDQIIQGSSPFVNRRLVLQSGGKNTVLVHSSANIDEAVSHVLKGSLRAAGQLCSSTSRVVVFRSLVDEFSEKIKKALDKVQIGPTDIVGDMKGPDMGPLYSSKLIQKFLRFQTMANREAKETLFLGRSLEVEGTKGYFVSPAFHILDTLDSSSSYQNNVLFCPDVAIYPYDKLEDAIGMANATDSSLCVSFCGDQEVLKERAALLKAPNILMNQPTVEEEVNLPLSGRQQNSKHVYQGVGYVSALTYPQMIIEGTSLDQK